MHKPENLPIWSLPDAEVLKAYETTPEGLSIQKLPQGLRRLGKQHQGTEEGCASAAFFQAVSKPRSF